MKPATIDFHTLYTRYLPAVRRFVFYLSGDANTADEIAEETFVRVWTASEAVRLATAKAYLFTIARNLHRQGARRAGRKRALDERMSDPSPGPEAQAVRRDELSRVLRHLQRLSETDRAALLMRAQDGLPYDEIAAALGLTLPAVKVRIHRARLRLRRLRQEEEGIE